VPALLPPLPPQPSPASTTSVPASANRMGACMISPGPSVTPSLGRRQACDDFSVVVHGTLPHRLGELVVTLGVWTGLVALCWAGCREATPPARPAAKPPRSQAKAAAPDPLCHGRPRCSVVDRRAAGPAAGSVVIVRLAAAANAPTDEERCDRREYWLTRPAGNLLLAVDCEAQWGADNAGPASLSVTGDLARFRYVELMANDDCETVEASIRLPEARIDAQVRRRGKVVRDQCRASRTTMPSPAPGSGAADDPLLVLHRP
jgi:hypothetical protein